MARSAITLGPGEGFQTASLSKEAAAFYRSSAHAVSPGLKVFIHPNPERGDRMLYVVALERFVRERWQPGTPIMHSHFGEWGLKLWEDPLSGLISTASFRARALRLESKKKVMI